MQRNLLGIVSLGLIVSGAIGVLYGYRDSSTAGMAAGVGMRAGLVLGALWIAYPQLVRMISSVPGWLLGFIGLGALVVVIRPSSFLLVGIAVAVLVALQFAGRFLTSPSKSRRHVRRRTDRPHAPPRNSSRGSR